MWKERKEQWNLKKTDQRTSFEVDYGRIIHSAALRRLQGKMQVYDLGHSDFYRNRLTHSLEVSQIALGILQALIRNPLKRSDFKEDDYKEIFLREFPKNEDEPEKIEIANDMSILIQSISLLHDIGHPPFGHGGEKALNYCMRDQGGFEGNGQTVRIATKLEKFSENAGMNLTRRTLLGILKYPKAYKDLLDEKISPQIKRENNPYVLDLDKCTPPKCYLDTEREEVEWILKPFKARHKETFTSQENSETAHSKTKFKSFDCSVVDLADDISNAIHDLEDAIHHDFITSDDFREHITQKIYKPYLEYKKENSEETNKTEEELYDKFVKSLFSKAPGESKREISRLVGFFIAKCKVETTQINHPFLKYKATLEEEVKYLLDKLKNLCHKHVIANPKIQHLEFKGQNIIINVFNILANDPKRFLQSSTYQKYLDQKKDIRVISDHIAGMTDRYLSLIFERLMTPNAGSIFDHL